MSSKLKELRLKKHMISSVNKMFATLKTLALSRLHKYQKELLHIDKMILKLQSDIQSIKTVNVQSNNVLVLGSNNGFCGSFNTKLISYMSNFDSNIQNILCLGKKTYSILNKQYQSVTLIKDLSQIEEIIKENYIILYMNYENLTSANPSTLSLHENQYTYYQYPTDEYSMIDHSWKNIYSMLSIRKSLLNSYLSEYSARVLSMDGANKNAQNMLNNIDTLYNGLRQEKITNEIIEINSSIEALR